MVILNDGVHPLQGFSFSCEGNFAQIGMLREYMLCLVSTSELRYPTAQEVHVHLEKQDPLQHNIPCCKGKGKGEKTRFPTFFINGINVPVVFEFDQHFFLVPGMELMTSRLPSRHTAELNHRPTFFILKLYFLP